MEFIQQNIWLVLIAAFSGIMLLLPIVRGKLSGALSADTTQTVQLINHQDALILDVREANEFAGGHIANARHIPLGQLATSLKPLEKHKDKTIVVNCQSGTRSAMACGVLRKNGFSQVYNLKGGIKAWEQAGLPVVK
ncbi:MAG: rhodanese-like domain-containing protein [Sulfuriferula sp.]